MFLFNPWIFSVLVSAFPSDLDQSSNGINLKTKPPKIVGGVAVTPPFKYPWIVSLQSSGVHFCGGSLLNANTIITAAHCYQRPIWPTLRVVAHRNRLSSTESSEEALVFAVTKINNHPQFSYSSGSNDVSIWKISLIQGNSSMIPAGVVELDDGNFANHTTEFIIAGWGKTVFAESPPEVMMEAKVDFVPSVECKTQNPTLHPTSICASRTGSGICQGDSGGPLFYQRHGKVILVGLTSYGQVCMDPDNIGVYTRLSALADWIKPQLNI